MVAKLLAGGNIPLSVPTRSRPLAVALQVALHNPYHGVGIIPIPIRLKFGIPPSLWRLRLW